MIKAIRNISIFFICSLTLFSIPESLGQCPEGQVELSFELTNEVSPDLRSFFLWDTMQNVPVYCESNWINNSVNTSCFIADGASLELHIFQFINGLSAFSNSQNGGIIKIYGSEDGSNNCGFIFTDTLFVGGENGTIGGVNCTNFVYRNGFESNIILPTEVCPFASISGQIKTCSGMPIENVRVAGNHNQPQSSFIAFADSLGEYELVDTPTGFEYEISASIEAECGCGVNTRDLLLMRSIQLGFIGQYDSPFKQMASDINNDKISNTVDLIEAMSLIMGVYSELPNSPCWKFLDEAQDLGGNPFLFEETIVIEELLSDTTDLDFVGISIGDVDGSCMTTPEFLDDIIFETEDQLITAGDTIQIDITSNNFVEVFGMQYTLSHDGLNLLEVLPGDVNLSTQNYTVINQGERSTFSWFDSSLSNPVTSNQTTFTLVFEATEAVLLSEVLDLNSDITSAEAYTTSDFLWNNLNLVVNPIEEICSNPSNNSTTDFVKLFGTAKNESIRDIFKNENGIYIIGNHTDEDSTSAFVVKHDLFGIEEWKLELGDSIFLNDIKVFNNDVYFVGQSPFSFIGNSKSYIGVITETNSVGKLSWMRSYDSFRTLSNGVVRNQGDRLFNVLEINGNIYLHGSGWLGPQSQEATTLMAIDSQGDILSFSRSYLSGNQDPQFWREFKEMQDGGLLIFGRNDLLSSSNSGLFGISDSTLNFNSSFQINGARRIYDGIDIDGENILLVGEGFVNEAFIGIISKTGEIINSKYSPLIDGISKVYGPFPSNNDVETFFGLGWNNNNGEVNDILLSFTLIDREIEMLWSKTLQIEKVGLDNQRGVLWIDSFNEFTYADSRFDSLNNFGNTDIILSKFDSSFCYLIDYPISLVDKTITVERMEFENLNYEFPVINNLTDQSSRELACYFYTPCTQNTCLLSILHTTQCNIIDLNSSISGFVDESLVNYNWSSPNTNFTSTSADTTYIYGGNLSEIIICLEASDGSCTTFACDTIPVTQPEAPIIENCPDVIFTEILEECNVLADFSSITAIDNCTFDSLPLLCVRDDGLELSDPYPVGNTNIICTATSSTALTSICQWDLIVLDNLPPTIECENLTIPLDITGTSFIDINSPGIIINDECGIENTFIEPEIFSCQDLGQSQYNVIATDINGNQMSCLGNVLIIDQTIPTITCEDVIIELDADGQHNFTIDDIDYLATDNCSIEEVQFDSISVNCFSNLNSYELSVFDSSGNEGFCTGNVTITDNLPPVVTCNELSITLNEQGFAILDIGNTDVSAIDNCGSVNFTLEPNVFTCDDLGEVPYVLIATDLSNNEGSCQNLIIVEDASPEIVDCPVVEIYLDESGLAELTVDDIQAEISTNCSIVTLELISNTSFNCNNSIEVYELVATDSSNNSSTCSNLISVIDTFPPSITDCLELLVDLDTNGEANYSFSDIEVLVSDNCNNYSIEEIESGILSCEDPIRNYVVKVLDQSGIVSDSCSNLIVAVDNMVPICEVSDVFIDNPNDEDFIPAEFVINAIDNCAVADVSSDIQVGDLLECGTSNIVNVLVSDDTGNTTDCSFVITTGDCADIDCSANAEIVYQGCGQFIANANAFDFQNEVVFSWSVDQIIIQESLSSSFETVLELGTHIVCVVASDGICESQFCETVVVDDIIFEFSNCPVNQFIGDCDFTFDINSVTANSICNGEPAIIESFRSDGMPIDAVLPLGTTEFICEVTDAQSTTCIFSISIFDNSNPICNSIESLIIDVDNNGAAFVSISDLDLGSFDNCGEVSIVGDNVVILNCNIFSGVLSYEIEDESGQSSECFVIIDLIDNLPPICVLTETTVSLDQTGQGMIIVSDLDGGSSDNCGFYSYEPSELLYTCDDIGTNVLSTNIVDQYGNASPCTTNVDVVSSDIPECNFNDLIVSIPESGNVIINSDLFMNSIQSDCGDIEIFSEELILSCNDIGTSIVNVTLNGSFGTLDCEVNIILEDNITPICQSFNYNAFLDINGTVAIDINQLNNVAIDNCAVNLIEPSQSIFDCSQLGNNQSVVTVMDISGNSQDCSYTVTVIDDIQPLCEDFIIELQLDSFGVGTVDDILSVMDYYDNCGVLSVESNLNTFDCSDIGSNNIVLTLTDTNGNVSQCDASVVIIDQPFECNLPNLNISLDEDGLATFDLENMVEFISGGCSDYTFSTIPLTFNCEDLGDNEIVLDVFDGGVIIETCNAIVTVEDNLSPLCLTESIIIDADNDYGAIVNLDIEVTDNCSLSDILYSIENGSFLECGSYMLTATVIDESQNNTECMIQLDVTGCGSCCESEADFLSIASSEILLSSNFNMEEKCLVTINKPNLSMCQYITEVIWGDETETRGMFSNETSIEHLYTSPGDYDICITYEEMSTNSDSCFNEQICEKFTLTDICEIKKSINSPTLETKLNVWPNPSSNLVNVALESRFFDVEINRLELYDTQGILFYNFNEESKDELYKINLSDLDRGLYLLNATLTNGINLSHKIIKI